VDAEHLRQIKRVYSSEHYALYEQLDVSLDPRGPRMLLEAAGPYLTATSRILDIGCRDARYLIELVQTHGCRGVGLDPLDWHIEQALHAVAEAELSDRIEITKGVMQHIQEPTDSFDFIWCRDVLVLVDELEECMREAARVLASGGAMLAYTNVATDLLEPKEATRLNTQLGNVARNFDESVVECAFTSAGLVIDRKDVIGTEWREFEEERERPVSQSLLRLARLRRRRAEITELYGEDVYERAEASLHWLGYQLLGKLKPVLYVLKQG
jgi:ubiquinone/menaquinone biosynthesis C-methylase UbiE